MDYVIRKARFEDMESVRTLIQELADYEKEPDAVELSVEELQKDGFGENPLFFCYVAERNNQILGMALFYFRYSTWKGKTVHLEDLVIRAQDRRKGIGSALLQAVLEFARAQQVRRVEWAVLDWNKPAIALYKQIGAQLYEDWNLVQMNAEEIKSYLNQLKSSR